MEGFNEWNGAIPFRDAKPCKQWLASDRVGISTRPVDVRYGERVQSIELSLVDLDFKKDIWNQTN